MGGEAAGRGSVFSTDLLQCRQPGTHREVASETLSRSEGSIGRGLVRSQDRTLTREGDWSPFVEDTTTQNFSGVTSMSRTDEQLTMRVVDRL